MIQQSPALDQLPSNVKIVDPNGMPTQAFVFYLLKLLKRSGNDTYNFETLQNQIDNIAPIFLTVSSDYSVKDQKNHVILADATYGTITVKLPNPGLSKGNTISIGKIDMSANSVVIRPYTTELVASEELQELLYQHEILDLISDGANWYIGG